MLTDLEAHSELIKYRCFQIVGRVSRYSSRDSEINFSYQQEL